MMTTEVVDLTDDEYAQALEALAEYERQVADSERLAQTRSLEVAARLDQLYRDQRWVEERNLERSMTAKTPRGGRPVDPTSRSQFSTWVRGRYNQIPPQHVYRLLDANMLVTTFFTSGERTPTAEAQVRVLKPLLSKANGSGSRIPQVWALAVELAEGKQPTAPVVREAIAEWRRRNLTQTQHRQERAEDRAWVKERRAVAAWKELLRVGSTEHINAFIAEVERDVEQLEATGERPA